MSIKTLQREELEMLLRFSNTEAQIIIRIMYETGCTIPELAQIKAKDFQPQIQSLKIANRNAIISTRLTQLLLEQTKNKRPEDPMIRASVPGIRKKMIELSEKTGIEFTPQTLRYTHIANAITNDITPMRIALQVGLQLERLMQIYDELKPKTDDYAMFFAQKV